MSQRCTSSGDHADPGQASSSIAGGRLQPGDGRPGPRTAPAWRRRGGGAIGPNQLESPRPDTRMPILPSGTGRELKHSGTAGECVPVARGAWRVELGADRVSAMTQVKGWVRLPAVTSHLTYGAGSTVDGVRMATDTGPAGYTASTVRYPGKDPQMAHCLLGGAGEPPAGEVHSAQAVAVSVLEVGHLCHGVRLEQAGAVQRITPSRDGLGVAGDGPGWSVGAGDGAGGKVRLGGGSVQ